jgi:hypothetical protein
MLRVSPVSIRVVSAQEDERTAVGNVAVAEELERVRELEDLYKLTASENEPEGMPDPAEPEGMPDPAEPGGMPDPAEPEGMPDPMKPEGMPDP